MCVGLSSFRYNRLPFFCGDRAVICHDVGKCQDPHGSALWLGTTDVRSDFRNPCCEVASFSDVIGVERVD